MKRLGRRRPCPGFGTLGPLVAAVASARGESASALAQFAGAAWADACEHMRLGWAPPFEMCILALCDGPLAKFVRAQEKVFAVGTGVANQRRREMVVEL